MPLPTPKSFTGSTSVIVFKQFLIVCPSLPLWGRYLWMIAPPRIGSPAALTRLRLRMLVWIWHSAQRSLPHHPQSVRNLRGEGQANWCGSGRPLRLKPSCDRYKTHKPKLRTCWGIPLEHTSEFVACMRDVPEVYRLKPCSARPGVGRIVAMLPGPFRLSSSRTAMHAPMPLPATSRRIEVLAS